MPPTACAARNFSSRNNTPQTMPTSGMIFIKTAAWLGPTMPVPRFPEDHGEQPAGKNDEQIGAERQRRKRGRQLKVPQISGSGSRR